MITLHHLNQSRSKRIIWLLEELGLDYQIVAYQRDKSTFLAPPELKTVHPLGKSPVLEDDGLIVTESAAITDYLIEKYGQQFAPQRGSIDYVNYQQWLHFAESSAILPLLLQMFVAKDGCQTNFLKGYADHEAAQVMGYFDQSLAGKTYLVAERLTGADVMMSFIAELLVKDGVIDNYPNIARYLRQLATHPAYQKANQIEAQHA